jgi:hypothetical protein
MQQVRIGLIGLGTVGSGVYQAIQKNGALMASRLGVQFHVAKVVVRDLEKKRSARVPASILTTDWASVVEDGFRDMAQARYYYALWPGFALALALLWKRAGPGPVRRITTAALTISLVGSSAAYAVIRLYLAGMPAIY